MRKKIALVAGALVAVLAGGSAWHLYAQAKAAATSDDKAEIEDAIQEFNNAFQARDISKIMSFYAPGKNLFVFDVVPPREYASWDAYKRDWEALLSAYPGPISNTITEESITVSGTMAYSHVVDVGTFTRKDGSKLNVTVRVTDVYRKLNGKWLVVHEHVSVPVDLETGAADLLSKK